MKKIILFSILAVSISLFVSVIPVFAVKANAYTSGEQTTLTKTLRLEGYQQSQDWMTKLYNTCKGLLNIVLLIGLIFSAIAMMLHIEVDTYTIKKILPKLIIAVVLGNLILPTVALGSSIIDNLSIGVFSWTATDTVSIIGNNFWDSIKTSLKAFLNGYTFGVAPWIALAGMLASLAPLFIIIVLNILLALRFWIVLLATVLGPIAIGLSLFPFTETLFKKWYKILIFWLVYPLIVNFLIFVIKNIPDL